MFAPGTTTASTAPSTTSTTTPTVPRTSTIMANTSLAQNNTPFSLSATTRTATAETTSTTSTTAATTTLARVSASASMTVASTAKTTATLSRKYDRDLIAMIIVVSVTGGILVLAVFMLIFIWVHWKKCCHQKGDHRNGFQSVHYIRNDQHHKRHYTSEIYSTTQMKNTRKDYYFYAGKINPVYDGTNVTNSVYLNEETFHNNEYADKLPEGFYQYNHNWN